MTLTLARTRTLARTLTPTPTPTPTPTLTPTLTPTPAQTQAVDPGDRPRRLAALPSFGAGTFSGRRLHYSKVNIFDTELAADLDRPGVG